MNTASENFWIAKRGSKIDLADRVDKLLRARCARALAWLSDNAAQFVAAQRPTPPTPASHAADETWSSSAIDDPDLAGLVYPDTARGMSTLSAFRGEDDW
jgi:hypothetical protein